MYVCPIVLKHLTKSFARKAEFGSVGLRRKRREVLKDVSLSVGKGEIACVLGKNGSGKTTLIRILSTLIEPDQGEARICGFDAVAEGPEVRLKVGVMLNAGDGGFHPRLSGFGNLEYYATLYRIRLNQARTRIRDLLADLQLQERGSDQYQSYSSGMRRRLALARAMIPDTPVLLLDEPTLGVDPWSTESIHQYLIALSRLGKTILCTTNSIAEAHALGNNAHVLEEGKLSLMGRPEVDAC